MIEGPILITGANGQLGWELRRSVPEGVEAHFLGRNDLDLTDQPAVGEWFDRLKPALVINAAAYTAVDKAEEEPGLAYAVNRDGAACLAEAGRAAGARMVQISTDFVFDGRKGRPYRPDDPVGPVGVYGASKLAGEQAVEDVLGDRALILRTAWVYSAHGGNFVKTMLRLMGEKESLSVVADQVGSPTWAAGLANAIWDAADKRLKGIHHWTDAGVASWYDFAVAIQEEALAIGLLKKAIPISPIRTEDYPTAAKRPPYSVLDRTETWEALGIEAMHWRGGLREMLAEVSRGIS